MHLWNLVAMLECSYLANTESDIWTNLLFFLLDLTSFNKQYLLHIKIFNKKQAVSDSSFLPWVGSLESESWLVPFNIYDQISLLCLSSNSK